MLLSGIRLVHVGPFEDLAIPFAEPSGAPRRTIVLFGGDGVGKTSLLAAIAATRPGYAVAQLRTRGEDAPVPFVVTDWALGDDDPARAHALRVVSPNARLDEPEDAAAVRRREQSLFERRAAEGGFALVAFSGLRWFSRSAVLLTTPERTILRHDVRATTSFDDATRTDLTRETKQVLSFASVAAALARGARSTAAATPPENRFEALERALHEVLGVLLEGLGAAFVGADPARLEPMFETGAGRRVGFDELGRSTRHLVAFGALTLRALAAAHPHADPRHAEGVALIDDIEAQQELHRQGSLLSRLRSALPRVQWIVTTASPAVVLGGEPSDVVALRREPSSGRIELHEGPDAVIH